MDSLKHLQPSVHQYLELSNEERIDWIKQPRWIGYPRAQQILRKLEDLLKHPKQERMPSMLVVGRSNNGKTRLIKHFAQKHLPDENVGGESIKAPVLFCEAPSKPSDSALYTTILNSLYERVPSSSSDAKKSRTVEVLKNIGLKVLIIDEMHNVLAGSSVKQTQFLNAIKSLSNELSISIVGCGTGDLIRAVSIDEQIQNRFTPEILPLWKYDKSYRQLLMSFESLLPLKIASGIHNPELAKKVHAFSEGTIGETSKLLNDAAIYAIETGEECITSEIINNCGYTPPSDRARLALKV